MGRDYTGENISVDDIPELLELESVDSLIYVGSHYDGPDPASFLEQTPHWVDASRRAGVRQFIYLSDYRVYGIKPGQPMPVTERADINPMPAHLRLAHAEPKSRRPQNIPAPTAEMPVAVLRTAMTVGPSGASPASVEFFAANCALAVNRTRRYSSCTSTTWPAPSSIRSTTACTESTTWPATNRSSCTMLPARAKLPCRAPTRPANPPVPARRYHSKTPATRLAIQW